jgi:hypothetical protein
MSPLAILVSDWLKYLKSSARKLQVNFFNLVQMINVIPYTMISYLVLIPQKYGSNSFHSTLFKLCTVIAHIWKMYMLD